jgi:hypothetical protein
VAPAGRLKRSKRSPAAQESNPPVFAAGIAVKASMNFAAVVRPDRPDAAAGKPHK